MTADATSLRAQPDGALVRRVRLRLLAWSGGTTLVVLVALGAVLYAAVANSLSSAAIEQLQQRARILAGALMFDVALGRPPAGGAITVAPDAPGVVIGGPTSGTVAFVVDPQGRLVGLPPAEAYPIRMALGDPVGDARSSTIRESEIAGTAVRILSVPVERREGTFTVQVVGDRTAEQRTLGVVLAVLAGGGLVALLVALGVGWVYAERAIVPIRDALGRQREFAADASHELRTPLTIVRGSVEHLRRHPEARVADVGSALHDIDAGVDRLAGLVDDLLLLARADSGAVEFDRTWLDLAEVALDAADGLAAVAAAQEVRVEVDAEPAPVRGDPARLRQLVALLVDNAIRHAPDGSAVRVAVRPGATLLVEDEGPGIRPADLPHLFDRFWRAADAPEGGAGLGLAIAAWIVEGHGGAIEAGNRPEGRGARFEIRIPA